MRNVRGILGVLTSIGLSRGYPGGTSSSFGDWPVLTVFGRLHDLFDEVGPHPDQARVLGEVPRVHELTFGLHELTVDGVAREVVALDLTGRGRCSRGRLLLLRESHTGRQDRDREG